MRPQSPPRGIPVENRTRLIAKVSDFFSFEVVFVLFLFAGTFKAAPILEPINSRIDLTAVLVAAGWACGSFVFFREQRWPVGLGKQYAYLLFLFFAYEIVLFAIGQPYERSRNTVLRIIGMSTWAVIAPLFIINSHLRIQRLLRLSFVFLMILGLNSLFITKSADASNRTVVRAGTFGAAQEDDGSYGEAGRYAADGVTMAAVAFLFSSNLLERILLIGNLAILGMMVQLAGARQAILGLLASSAYLFVALTRRPGAVRQIFKGVIAIGLLGFCFVYVRGMIYEDDQLAIQTERLWSAFTDDGGGVLDRSQRSKLWLEGINLWQKSPIIGNGLGAMEWTHPHNFFVEMLCDGGIVGLLIGSLVIAVPALLILQSMLTGAGAYFMILSSFWLNHFVFSMVSGDVGQNRIVYTLSALVVSYCTDGQRRRRLAVRPGFPRESSAETEPPTANPQRLPPRPIDRGRQVVLRNERPSTPSN